MDSNIFFKNFKIIINLNDKKKLIKYLKKINSQNWPKFLDSYKKKYVYGYDKKFIKKFKNIQDINIIGMGGSSLGAKAIYNFLKDKIAKKFLFLENLNLKNKIQRNRLNVIISKSGGARMMEAAISLMQLAKTSAKLAQLADAKVPYISLCTDPTTGGTTASFAMLGDVNISEPGALIGFAGPRVVKDTTGKDLPKGFQTAEFVLDHGFLDFITHRRDLKKKINLYLDLILNNPIRN